MDDRSERLLADVHPDLARVIRAAAQEPQPFLVVQGLRTLAAEAEAVATGHSETMHSRHFPDPKYDDKAMAVDVDDMINGRADPAFGGVAVPQTFGQIAAQVLAAAKTLGIAVQWGGQEVGAWVDGETSHFRDWGHFQLDPKEYPQ